METVWALQGSVYKGGSGLGGTDESGTAWAMSRRRGEPMLAARSLKEEYS
jgi:hypothetical protein